MKIEICEQMLQSWLQNCQLCEIVQTNWTISPLRAINPLQIDEVEIFMKDVQTQLNRLLDDDVKTILQNDVDDDIACKFADGDVQPDTNTSNRKVTKIKHLDIFKKSTAHQFIRQCEIDIVGVKLDDGITERIFLIDTAFHKSGLGYKDAVARVVKKIIRALVVALLVFGKSAPVTVAFAAPKCSHQLANDIETVVNALRPILGVNYSNMDIELYFNERFATEIYLPLKKEINNLNNDNDLFMRALNLAATAESNLPTATSTPTVSATPAVSATPTSHSGKHKNETLVFDFLNTLIATNKMTPALLSDLQQPVFAKRTFRMPTYPILLEETRFPASGYERCRFYSTTININGTVYLVCSQWIPARIAALETWFNSL